MPFRDKDKALIKNLHQFKVCGLRKIWRNFRRKLEEERTGHFTKKDLGNRKHRPKAWEQQNEAQAYWREWRGHCRWTCRLTKPGRPDIYRSTRQKGESNIIGIIPCDAGLKYLFRSPKRLFSTIVSFSYINISQSSVATQLKCGGIFNTYVIANCPQNVTVKEFLKSVNIWRRYGQRFGGTFLWLTMYILVIF